MLQTKNLAVFENWKSKKMRTFSKTELWKSLALFLLGTMSLAGQSNAEVISLEVELKAVDIKQRTILATRKGKQLELSLTKSAAFKVNGVQASIKQVLPGRLATIKYETSLEVVTSIEIKQDFDVKSLTLRIDSEGRLTLSVNEESSERSDSVDGSVNSMFGNALTRKLGDGRLQRIYDFSKNVSLRQITKEKSIQYDREIGVASLLYLRAGNNAPLSFTGSPVEVRFEFFESPADGDFYLSLRFNEDRLDMLFKLDEGFANITRYRGKQKPEAQRVMLIGEPVAMKPIAISSKNTKSRFNGFFGNMGHRPIPLSSLMVTGFAPPTFGIQFEDTEVGIRVKRVVENPPYNPSAGKVLVGDILLEVNSVAADDVAQAIKLLRTCTPGIKAKLHVKRFGQEKNVSVTPVFN